MPGRRTNHVQQGQQMHTPHMEPRVSRLESVVEGLDGDIQALSSNFDRMAKNTSDSLQRVYDIIERQSTQFNNSISVLQTTIAGTGKANWPVMFSACGLVLAISATVGGLALQPLKDRQSMLEAQATTKVELAAAREVDQLHYQMNEERIDHVRELLELSRPRTTGPAPSGPGPSALLPATQAAP